MFLIPISSQPETHKVAYASSYLFYYHSEWQSEYCRIERNPDKKGSGLEEEEMGRTFCHAAT